MNSINHLLTSAANLIAKYNPQLAKAWIARPFSRVDMARAFAAGFGDKNDDGRDIHPHASLVLEVALMDQRIRRQLGGCES